MAAALAGAHGVRAAGRSPGPDLASVRAAGGIVIRHPRDWSAAATRAGTIVVLVGPMHGGVRPAATFILTRGEEAIGEMLNSAARGLGTSTPITLLGERHLTPTRWARYYIRGDGATAEYVAVGVAQGHGWMATMVAVDAVADPLLRDRAGVFQGLLADVIFSIPQGR